MKRKVVHQLYPKDSEHAKSKAHEYGYLDRYSNHVIAPAQMKFEKSLEPVAKDTNKTRRKMVNPTLKGSY